MSVPRGIAVQGAAGRMGSAVVRLLAAADDLEPAYRADRSLPRDPGPPRSGPDLDEIRPGEVQGIIDFTSADGTRAACGAAVRLGCPLVGGATALDEAAREALRTAAASVPVCWSPNFSLGVPLLRTALREASRRLPAGWQLEIVEVHHGGKRDAPSGTALALAEVWRGERGGEIVPGRQGLVGPRREGEIGVHAVRLGDAVGEHRVLLAGTSEGIEAVHRVTDRTAFAAGCIEALRRLLRQGPGLYEWDALLFRG